MAEGVPSSDEFYCRVDAREKGVLMGRGNWRRLLILKTTLKKRTSRKRVLISINELSAPNECISDVSFFQSEQAVYSER